MTESGAYDERTRQIQQALATVRARIEDACLRCGRDPREVTLIVVTKTWPAEDVARLYELGVRDVGENRDQEAAPKAAQVNHADLRWHFVGQLQSNKAASTARYAHVVHSVDRLSLVDALDRGAARANRVVDCLVQVSLDPPDRPGRGGADPDGALAIAEAIDSAPNLRLRGVMGVAPLDGDPYAAFVRLGGVAASVRAAHPEADIISAGMSDDMDEAIRAGATHLRVGSAILGSRPTLG